MDYMTVKEASEKLVRNPSAGKLLLRRRPYSRRGEDGDNLVDTQRRRETA